nr:DNA polymerase [Wolbachia endosymbiont of Atemnus politus]
MKGTYTVAIIKRVNPLDGRVHTSFSTTATGRLSSSNPNLQIIPIRIEEGNFIRQAFIYAKWIQDNFCRLFTNRIENFGTYCRCYSI